MLATPYGALARTRINEDQSEFMPLAAKNNLDQLYAQQRLVLDEAERLERDRDQLDASGADADRRYILDLESRALLEESTRLGSAISDILERDLQR
jgi:hypothetical protein